MPLINEKLLHPVFAVLGESPAKPKKASGRQFDNRYLSPEDALPKRDRHQAQTRGLRAFAPLPSSGSNQTDLFNKLPNEVLAGVFEQLQLSDSVEGRLSFSSSEAFSRTSRRLHNASATAHVPTILQLRACRSWPVEARMDIVRDGMLLAASFNEIPLKQQASRAFSAFAHDLNPAYSRKNKNPIILAGASAERRLNFYAKFCELVSLASEADKAAAGEKQIIADAVDDGRLAVKAGRTAIEQSANAIRTVARVITPPDIADKDIFKSSLARIFETSE